MSDTNLDSLRLDLRAGLPDSLRALVKALPADGWTAHPGFGGLTQFWIEKHAGFRHMLELIGADAQSAAGGAMATEAFAPRLYRAGGSLLGELHGHHSIEDAHYFPQLRQLEPSVARGFDLLEADHRDLDAHLQGLAQDINGLLRSAQAGTLDADGVEPFVETLDRFRLLLVRHLVDEEEIVIPALLRLSSG